MGAGYGSPPGSLPVTESVSERLVRLPCYFELGDAEQQRVIDAILKFYAA